MRLALLLALSACSVERSEGVVLAKHYEGSRTSVGTGTHVTSNGRVGTHTTVHTSPSRRILAVRDANGRIFEDGVRMETFYATAVGDSITVKRTKLGDLVVFIDTEEE